MNEPKRKRGRPSQYPVRLTVRVTTETYNQLLEESERRGVEYAGELAPGVVARQLIEEGLKRGE